MWDLPGPGLEPVSPALAGGFLTTVPPGKSLSLVDLMVMLTLTVVFVKSPMLSYLSFLLLVTMKVRLGAWGVVAL